jgi:hypothetical protein
MKIKQFISNRLTFLVILSILSLVSSQQNLTYSLVSPIPGYQGHSTSRLQGSNPNNNNDRSFNITAQTSAGANAGSGQVFAVELYSNNPSCTPSITTPYCLVNCAPTNKYSHTANPACLSNANVAGSNNGPYWVPATVTDNLDSNYTVTYYPEYKGIYDISIAQLLRGGLNVQYFDNVWFLGNPDVFPNSTVDYSAINHTWGTGIVSQYGVDYVSVRWTGKVKPPITGNYTFSASCDDWCRVWIDQRIIIDHWGADTNASVVSWGSAALVANFYHEIRVEYAELRGSASISLRWRSNSGVVDAVVPASAFYYRIPLANSPYSNVTISAADPPSASKSYVYADTTQLSSATAGVVNYFYFQAVDAFNNIQDYQSSVTPNITIAGPAYNQLWSSVNFLGSGKYEIAYNITQAGTFHMYVGIGADTVTNSPFALTVAPAASYAQYCYISNSTTGHVNASSYAQASFILSCRDQYNNTRSTGGDTVAVLISPTPLTVNVADLGTGQYKLTYNADLATGYYSLQVSVNGAVQGIYQLYVAPGDVYGPYVVVTGAALSGGTAGAAIPYTLQPYDLGNNAVVNSSLNFYHTLTNLATGSISTSSAMIFSSTDSYYHGSVTATATGKYSLAFVYRNSAGQTQSAGSTYTITIDAGAAVAAKSQVSSAINFSGRVGVAQSLTIQAKDANNNIADYGSAVVFTGTLTCSTSQVFSSTYSGSRGVYSLSYTPFQTGNCSLAITLSGSAIVNSPIYSIIVTAGVASSSTSSANGVGVTTGTAGTASVFNIQSYDGSNNPLTTGGNVYTVSLSGPQLVPVTVKDSNNGNYTVSYTAARAGTYSTAIALVQQGGLKGLYYNQANFAVFQTSNIDPIVAFNYGYSSPISGVPNSYFSIQWLGKLKAPASGIYTFYVQLSPNTGVQLTLNGANVIDRLTPTSGSTEVYGVASLNATSFVDISIKYTTTSGPNSIALLWSAAGIINKAIIDSQYLYYVNDIAGSPFTTTLKSAATNAAASVLNTASITSINPAVTAQPITFTVQLKDQYGNVQTDSADESSSISAVINTIGSGSVSTGLLVALGNGLYSGTITPNQVGSATLSVRYSGTLVSSGSISFTVSPGPVSAANCVVSLSPTTFVTAGSTVSFTIKAADANGNLLNTDVQSPGNWFSAEIRTGTPSSASISYAGAGLYKLSITPTAIGNQTLSISLGTASVGGTPYYIIVSPGAVSSAASTVLASQLNGTTVGTSLLAVIELRDSFSNVYSTSADTQFLITLSNHAAIQLNGFTHDFNNGTYELLYNATTTGSYTAHISLASSNKGLTGNYYNNRWLQDSPVLTRIDPLINFDFNSDLITPTAKSYVSVSWTGYLYVDSASGVAQNISFQVNCDDGARLFINNELIIDSWANSGGFTGAASYIFPQYDMIYPIRLDYRQNTGPAAVKLSWNYPVGAGSSSFSVIPSSHLYSAVTEIPDSPFDIFVN